MAAYDYTTTYYTTYFQFNAGTDTGHGNDNDKPFAVTSADTGHGTDAVVSVSFFFSDSDTGSGVDASASPKVKNSDGGNGVEVATPGPQAADASHAAADNGGVTGGLFTLADADSALGADGSSTGLTDGDITNAVEIDLISDSDTWSGIEQAQPAVTGADTGTGAETQAPLRTQGPGDTFLGSDIGLSFAIRPAAGDAGSGADTETQPALPLSSADTGAGADAVSSILPAVSDSDSGSAAETQVLAAAVSSSDAAVGSDISNVRPDADTGTGLDAARVGVGDADTISAAETSPFPNARVRDGDTAAGLEGGFVNTPSKFDGDTAHAAEGTPGLLVRQSSADSGHVTSEGSSVDLADILFGTEESFSLIRAAVLTPGTGAEQLPLTGVRDGTMAPEYSVIPMLGDDAELSTWINLTKVTVTVSGGFISFPALSLLLGYPVSADSGNRYSAAWGMRSVPASTEVPLVLRASSRDVRGRPRTLDFVLYRVRFTSLTVESFAYKTGAVASWTAEALFSFTDETGAPLSTDGTEQDVGRLVASPGQLPSPIPALFNGRRAVTVRVSGSDTISALDGKVNALPTAKSSAEAFSATDSAGSINTGSSGADTGRAAESGLVTAATVRDSDTAALLDGKPLITVRLLNSSDTVSGLDSPGTVLIGGAAKSDVEAFHAVEGAIAEIDVTDSDTGSVFSNANVNPVGSTASISDSDSMFNNEHPNSTDTISNYIQVISASNPNVATLVGFRAPPGTWATVNSQVGPGQTQRCFYSGALPAAWGGGGGESEPPQDGSVTMIISFKTLNTNVVNFVKSVPNKVPCWFIYHHEPEGDYTTNGHGAQFVSEFVSQMTLVSQGMAARADNGVNIKRVFCSAGSPYPKNLDSCQSGSYIPPTSSTDAYMLDYYPGLTATSQVAGFTISKQTRLSLWLAALDNAYASQAVRKTRPLGFTEYGLNQCAPNTVRAGILAADCSYFRKGFPAQGTTYSGTLGDGTTNTPFSKFPMLLWEYWDMNQGTGCATTMTMDDDGSTVGTQTRPTWRAIASGAI